MNEPSILFLTRKGFSLLRNTGQLSGFPGFSPDSFEARANVSELTLRHELEIMDVKAAFHAALLQSGRFSLVEFCTWPMLLEFRARRLGFGDREVLVKPDGFLRIHEKEEGTKGFVHDFFLELDRSSETQDTLVARAACYLDFYRSADFAVRNGGLASDYKEYPFRALIVLKSAARRNNTAERLSQNNPPILTMTWLSTLDEVKAKPLDSIWIQPKDYLEATDGTIYACGRNPNWQFRRQPQREAFVESRIRKQPLLAEQL